MFKKILVPNDGSVLGNIAALRGIEMAAKHGAEVIGINVSREYQKPGFGKKVSPTGAEFAAEAKEASAKVMQPFEATAAKAGVKFTGIVRCANHTALAITRAADEFGCDLIFIGSHGCAGWDHILTGSVSTKVLATAKIPVLVYRLKEDEVPVGVPHSYELAFPE